MRAPSAYVDRALFSPKSVLDLTGETLYDRMRLEPGPGLGATRHAVQAMLSASHDEPALCTAPLPLQMVQGFPQSVALMWKTRRGMLPRP